jgi:hypothetical protein
MNNRDYGMNDLAEMSGDYDIDQEYKIDDVTAMKKNMPVKTHMRKMEEIIAELKTDLGNNRKNGQILRSENVALEHKTKEKCNEITKCIMDDLYNFDKDLKRVMQNDKTETTFFKQQLNSLEQDKTKLQHNVISLDTRLKVCESDVGVEYR